MKFRAEVELSGRTATGIEVPADVIDSLAAGKRIAVVATIKKHSYRSTVAPYNGRFMLPLSAENREAAGVAAGEVVTVDLVVDTAARDVEVPADLAAALKAVPGARAAFDALAPSHRKEHVRSVEEAKKAETRQRRIEKVVEKVSSSPR